MRCNVLSILNVSRCEGSVQILKFNENLHKEGHALLVAQRKLHLHKCNETVRVSYVCHPVEVDVITREINFR